MGGLIKSIEKKIMGDILAKLKNMEANVFGDIAKRLEAIEDGIENVLDAIKKQGAKQMAEIDDLNTQLAAVQSGLDDLSGKLTQATTDANKAFTDLKAAVAAGGTPQSLAAPLAAATAAVAKITAASQAISDFDAAAVAADAPAA